MAQAADKRKAHFDRHLSNSFDLLIFVQLVIIYLYDVSTVKLFLGLLLQMTVLSPRLREFPAPVPINKRQVIMTIVAYNGLCLSLHSIYGPPQASTGKYLHGSLTIEFIGVKQLSSRVPLIIFDVIVMMLQLCMFSINFPPREQPEATPLRDTYSGHAVIRNISIVQAIAENWATPVDPDAETMTAEQLFPRFANMV